MSKELKYSEYAAKALDILEKGAFLTTFADEKANTMTIGWGSISFIWGTPIFMVMVRPSRLTFSKIEKSGEFTVSIPLTDMKEALAICGSKSGRDIDKFEAAGLTIRPGKKIATPVIDGAGLHYECKIIYKQTMLPNELANNQKDKFYAQGDYHTMYFGEILCSYIDD